VSLHNSTCPQSQLNTKVNLPTPTIFQVSAHLQSAVSEVLQFRPQVVDVLLFLLDLRTLTVAACRQGVRCLVYMFNVFLVRGDLAQKLIELLLQNLLQTTANLSFLFSEKDDDDN